MVDFNKCIIGLMDLCMRDIGNQIKPMDLENFYIQTEICTRGNGVTTRLMEMVYSLEKRAENTVENGKMIYKMDMESRNG